MISMMSDRRGSAVSRPGVVFAPRRVEGADDRRTAGPRSPGRTTWHKARLALAVALASCACAPSGAAGAQSAAISAAFTSERLGAPTTVSLGFRLTTSAGQIPSPLTGLDFRYPADFGIATSGLGIAACDPAQLEANGAAGCPPDSIMGYGSAAVEVPEGGEVIPETASIVLVAGPSENGYLRLLVCATGLSPVAARIVMPTLLIAGHLHITVPRVPSLPEGPDVAVIRVHVTLGGHLTYYEHVDGRTVAYHPRGIVLPRRCPRGGFKFAATLSFLDGSHASAKRAVACPRGA
jgi:hypothetical protein